MEFIEDVKEQSKNKYDPNKLSRELLEAYIDIEVCKEESNKKMCQIVNKTSDEDNER
ncbi:hypothetical protein [Maledivibacter halophilus]|uniref:hypothetical protein n=1 Tax=Maledivibacter halophilus TaxID=36842 RepID=UPI00148360C1|nr:hypothetical protein [Maledivibacter halophilus]